MFMIPILIMVFLGMFELFTITFGAQNAHIRAREYVLHGGAYTSSKPSNENPSSMGTVFKNGNYIVAEKDVWGLASIPGGNGMNRGWASWANDRGIPGIARGTSDKGTPIRTTAFICSPVGCPPAP
jgi:hypothetical protein